MAQGEAFFSDQYNTFASFFGFESGQRYNEPVHPYLQFPGSTDGTVGIPRMPAMANVQGPLVYCHLPPWQNTHFQSVGLEEHEGEPLQTYSSIPPK